MYKFGINRVGGKNINFFVNKKIIYILLLFVICFLNIVLVPTYAKFGSNYTTPEDVVALALNFDLTISNIDEYEELVVPAGEVEKFNIEITNSTGIISYYGVWYKMNVPSELTSDIFIGKTAESVVNTTGSINDGDKTMVSLAIENLSNSDVKIYVGVNSSTTGISDIEYLDGRKLINKVWSYSSEVRCSTGSVATYYASLSDALEEASITADTTCTLLNNLTEDVSINKALKNTTIDLNGKTLTGYINNQNTNSSVTLKNGTITGNDGVDTIVNNGTLTIESGTFTSVNSYALLNYNLAKIYGGNFECSATNEVAAIINSGDTAFLYTYGGTVQSNVVGIANGYRAFIANMNIVVTGSGGGIFNHVNGLTRVINTTVTGTAALYNNVRESNTGLFTFNSTIIGHSSPGSAPVFQFTHEANATKVRLDLFNVTATRCGTWTEDGGQDDLVWSSATSKTSPYGGTYLSFEILYSDHNSKSSKYITHCYNDNTYVIGTTWYWNFEQW